MKKIELTPELRHVLQVDGELCDIEGKVIDALDAWYDFAAKIKKHSDKESDCRLACYKEIERLLVECYSVLYNVRDSLISEMPPDVGELFTDEEIGELS